MYESDADKEARLYRESRALKFQAREMRKKRIAKEKEVQAQVEANRLARELEKKTAAEKAARDRTKERDDRIRSALLEIAAVVKKYQLAFDSPVSMFGSWQQTTPKKDAFILIDKVNSKAVQIQTHPSGFSWN